MLYGTVGVGLALAMQAVGLLKRGDDWLLGGLLGPVFHSQMPSVLSLPVLILVTAVFCFGLAFVILDTVGTGRRTLIGVTLLVLVLAMVPTMAVWNIYFSPFLIIVGLFWSWFCTMMYVSQHLMPCEAAHIPPSILTVSSAYKTPPVSEEKKEVKQDVKKGLKEDKDKKYQPKAQEQEQVKGKEKVNG